VTHVPTGDAEPPTTHGDHNIAPKETDAQTVATSALSHLDMLFAPTDSISTVSEPTAPGTGTNTRSIAAAGSAGSNRIIGLTGLTGVTGGTGDNGVNGGTGGTGVTGGTGDNGDNDTTGTTGTAKMAAFGTLGAVGSQTGIDATGQHATSTRPVLELVDIQQVYGTGDAAVHALRGITLSVHAGDYVAIMGPSGSGKSTLMNLLGCLDIASSGIYSLAGNDVATLDEAQLAVVRNKEIGFIFQSFNLVPRMSAVANVELPLVYGGVKHAERRRRALEALDMVGLGHRANHQPQELSGGQQQRVAIARALVTNPTLVLADEPTGNLDSESTEEILGIFDALASQGRTIVIITHEDHVAERAHRVLAVSDGLIVVDRPARREVFV
jgi:putative ABC transport system ATP-binding protein